MLDLRKNEGGGNNEGRTNEEHCPRQRVQRPHVHPRVERMEHERAERLS